jgi:hypothetical protein
MSLITLPWPSSTLSGHANGHWRAKSAETAKHRRWAADATRAALYRAVLGSPIPDGDILLSVRFVPPNRRGDRTNFPNRMKAYFDGIADALGVNDSRFLPAYQFADPEAPGRVEVTVQLPIREV